MPLVVRNFEAFEQFRSQIASLPYLLPKLATRIGAAFVKQVADEFRESRDPYDKPWAPVVRNRRKDVRARARRAKAGKPPKSDKPLIDTGRLRASVVARTEGGVVRVALPVEYASYHQYGTRRIQRRQILPENNTGGLGPRWSAAAYDEAVAVLNEHFGKSPGGE
jgi:phage gpG-like protein